MWSMGSLRIVSVSDYFSRYDQGFKKLEELNKLLKPAQS
jgi:hypothetical protein